MYEARERFVEGASDYLIIGNQLCKQSRLNPGFSVFSALLLRLWMHEKIIIYEFGREKAKGVQIVNFVDIINTIRANFGTNSMANL
jgi:hypothetical protein